jgi:hypothetical protein
MTSREIRSIVLHKVGVTGSNVETRIANANLDPTFLMAEVEVVATYELYNINRIKLENLIHRVFDPAQFDTYIAIWLAKNYGLQYVGYYLTAAAALTLVGLLAIRETKDDSL